MALGAHIVGMVDYREGDGPKIVIPVGLVLVETTHSDATLSWGNGNTRGSTALPLSAYRRYVAEGTIKLCH